MIGRLRELAERPVSPGVARAIVATALAMTVALGCVVALGLGANHGPVAGHHDSASASGGPGAAPIRPAGVSTRTAPDRSRTPRQDPQDRPGTTAHRRAARELATHRALQHVPWHRGEVSIGLVGAKGKRAVLSVWGPTRAADRRAWHSFLRRFHDDGRSYLPRFDVAEGGRS